MFEFFTGPSPVTVPAAGVSGRLPFPALVSDDPDEPSIRLCVAALGDPPPGTPLFALAAAGSPPKPVTADFATITGADGTSVGEAATAADAEGTYRLRVIVFEHDVDWELLITNPDPVARRYVGVVADNATDMHQPWIDVPPRLAFSASLGQSQSLPLPVTNLGTGNLVVPAPVGGPAQFALTGVPATVPPNGTVTLTLTFTPEAAGDATFTYTVASSDLAATSEAPHNHVVSITTATTGPVPRPVITGFSPASGDVGDRVTVTGEHFDETGLQVRFGDHPALDVVAAADGKSLQATVPTLPAGRVTIFVSAAGSAGTPAASPTTFLVGRAPAFSDPPAKQFNPQSQTPSGSITINGSNLDRVAQVALERTKPTPTVSVAAAAITVVDMPAAPGTRLQVTLPGLALGSRHRVHLVSDFGDLRSDDTLMVTEV